MVSQARRLGGAGTLAAPSAPPGRRRGRWLRALAYAILIAYAVVMFVPFAWSVITSFKTLPDSVRLSFIPQPFTLEGWHEAVQTLTPPLPLIFLNSFAIAGAVTLTNVVLGSLAGYAFARLRFPGRELLFLIVLGTLMMPDQLRVIPVYLILKTFGLTAGFGQYVGVVVVAAIAGTSIFFLRQYFLSIPRDLEEAARMDGAGFFTTFWRVMLPLATPAIAAVAILQFQGSWNSFFWPVILLQDNAKKTIPVALYTFRTLSSGFSTNWPPLMAVIVAATIPILILYIFFQRYFVEGLAASGVKG
ncbi:MAG TPA: carbohydrate ABC transporter permease [Candidatus Limnocylindrales bacterium]|nr:carbohydrate ABC transporter permease [Candidatus Limnocylindrales bacterium]